jgi:A/G-specific adenine glycosylase
MRKQQLTHQQIRGQFIHIAINEIPEALQGLKWVNHQQISQLAFPRFITAYFEEEG